MVSNFFFFYFNPVYLSIYFLSFVLFTYYLYNFNVIVFVKNFKTYGTKKLNTVNMSVMDTDIVIYFYVQLYLNLTVKTTALTWTVKNNFIFLNVNLILLLGILGLFMFFFNKDKLVNMLFISIVLCFYLFICEFFFITNFLAFLVILELLAIMYYFFFLVNIEKSYSSFLKIKNLIISYLCLSFFTLVCFFLGLLLVFYYIGTVNFKEIKLLSNFLPFFIWFIFLTGLCWKLGVPGFHFFKLQIYSYLPLNVIILFSLFSTVVNNFVLIFFLIEFSYVYVNFSYIYLIFVLISNIVLLILNFKDDSFYHFLAYSALNTWTTVFMFCLV